MVFSGSSRSRNDLFHVWAVLKERLVCASVEGVAKRKTDRGANHSLLCFSLNAFLSLSAARSYSLFVLEKVPTVHMTSFPGRR